MTIHFLLLELFSFFLLQFRGSVLRRFLYPEVEPSVLDSPESIGNDQKSCFERALEGLYHPSLI